MNQNNQYHTRPVFMGDEEESKPWLIPVDEWKPSDGDSIFLSSKGGMWLPVTRIYNIMDPSKQTLDFFCLARKRCYNGATMLAHLTQYLNYFTKYYDRDHELVVNMARLKCNIDLIPGYTAEQLKFDIEKYILSDSLLIKAWTMNEDNYQLRLDEKKYKNDQNQSLIYTDRHAKIMLWMSILMNMVIPLATHYVYIRQIPSENDFLLWIFESILALTPVNIYNKIYETALSNVNHSVKRNEVLWARQDIRGKSEITHSIESVENIVLNIMPKYTYDKNIISFNYTSIRKNIHFQVTGNQYEYDFLSLSSSNRDADCNSAFDKYESYATKTDNGLYLANKVSSENTMKRIELLYGPFSQEEIEYYITNLTDSNGNVINQFQKTLVFNLFYKFFGDTEAINNINKLDYIKLVIAASRLLKANNLVVMPYIISSKIVKLSNKKTINKKEQARLEASANFQKIREKYKSEKIEAYILELIATIVASKFKIIDFYDKPIDGAVVELAPDLIYDEIAMYIQLI